ncbi:MAG TPA: protein kinase family protein [Streptosporangiaceae bacterium]|jgi:hypothetical protein|nr:protein kinase family protein [Streptosporangiaceae bacterium]
MSTFTSEPGTKLGGRYRLEDRLAAAGGWSAWKAIDEILARPVSVITFASGFPRLQQVVTAARAASRLTDTRLTQVFDVEDSWDHAYIVLEWPVGETLADLLAGDRLDPATGTRIIAETAEAISGAHAAGLAHLCLQPEAVRWTAGGGLKITGLGIDAALAGISAEDPELADTRGLGGLLYAVLTGTWPGPDHPDLPPAPLSEGRPRRPRQVRAGIPTSLDDIACKALGLDEADCYTSPAELADALVAVIPPMPIPPAAQPRRDQPRAQPARDQWRDDSQQTTPRRSAAPPAGLPPRGGPAPSGGQRRSTARVGVAVVLAVAAIVGLGAAAKYFLHSPAKASHSHAGGHSGHSSPAQSAQAQVLTPVAAQGFDALRTPHQDPTDENSSQAGNLLDDNSAGWQTQQYYGSPYFGNLKSGSGLILNMGKPVTISTVTITFGNEPGANVELKVGNSDARSAANEQSMTTVATRLDVSGQQTFQIAHPVQGQFLVVWFTKLPPLAGAHGKYEAQIFTIIVRGTD